MHQLQIREKPCSKTLIFNHKTMPEISYLQHIHLVLQLTYLFCRQQSQVLTKNTGMFPKSKVKLQDDKAFVTVQGANSQYEDVQKICCSKRIFSNPDGGV